MQAACVLSLIKTKGFTQHFSLCHLHTHQCHRRGRRPCSRFFFVTLICIPKHVSGCGCWQRDHNTNIGNTRKQECKMKCISERICSSYTLPVSLSPCLYPLLSPFQFFIFSVLSNSATPTHTHTHTPVSYTHLDVYKRQT